VISIFLKSYVYILLVIGLDISIPRIKPNPRPRPRTWPLLPRPRTAACFVVKAKAKDFHSVLTDRPRPAILKKFIGAIRIRMLRTTAIFQYLSKDVLFYGAKHTSIF